MTDNQIRGLWSICAAVVLAMIVMVSISSKLPWWQVALWAGWALWGAYVVYPRPKGGCDV